MNSANITRKRGFLEVKKFAVYLVVPILTVIAYNHPTTHPYFGRHTPLYPASDPEDDSLERAMELGFKQRAERLERERIAEEKRKQQLEQIRQQRQQ